eukprot:jgi/Orpsp1_1/1178139/evm.model.c7180000064191.2
MDNASSLILDSNDKDKEILINNNIENNINENENDVHEDNINKKIEEENIDKLIPLDDELFRYHSDAKIKNENENYDNENNNDDDNRNYITTTTDDNNYSISENSFKILRNEIKYKHEINVISEESENDDENNDKNNINNQKKNLELNENDDRNNEDKNNEDKNNEDIIKEDQSLVDVNPNNIKMEIDESNKDNYLKCTVNEDYSNESLAHIKKDASINKSINDNESFNFETDSIADNKSLANVSIYSLNKEHIDNINDQFNSTSNDAILLQSVDFSRSKINFGYNNNFDYLTYIKKAENYIKSYNIDNEDEISKNFILFKPFYSIANGIISKQLNDNEKITGSTFYTSHAGYINIIKKKVTLDFVWNSSIAQIYLLMFLIHRDSELANIF